MARFHVVLAVLLSLFLYCCNDAEQPQEEKEETEEDPFG